MPREHVTDSAELLPGAVRGAAAAPVAATWGVIRCGADVVYVAEDLYYRLFRMMLVLLVAASAWSVWARLADAQRGDLILTTVYATLGAAMAAAGFVLGWRAYAWLRYDRIRQFAPAFVAIVMLLTDGPHSATWWMAFALIFVMASVSSTSLTVLGALCAAAAYIAGTLVYGSPLIYRGDTGNVIGAAMLIVNAIVARSVGEAFGSFIMRLHRLEAQITQAPGVPRRVRNLASSPAPAPEPDGVASTKPRSKRGEWLTARQLEVAFLVRDGLHQDEIASCLSISRRQVERLLEQARERTGAATTGELIAMLVRRQFVPPTPDQLTDDTSGGLDDEPNPAMPGV
jgi:DNA-binding CsgD family transcriptional regulator